MGLFQKIHLKTNKQQVSTQLQLRFLQRLSRVLSNGYSLLSALETLRWDKTLHTITNPIIADLKSGLSIDQSLEKLRFNEFITTYLFFAKEYGDLESSIKKCVDIYEERIRYQQKLTQVIRYPIILLIVFSFVFFFIQQSVIPNILLLFQNSHQKLSAITFSVFISSVIYYSFITLMLLIILTKWLWKRFKSKFPISSQIKIYTTIPIYRSFLKLNTSYQFSTHMSSLLRTGLSLKDVLIIISKQTKLPILSHYATIIADGLNQGIHAADIVLELPLMKAQLAEIFQKNINTNTLQKDLEIYAIFLTDELNKRILKSITYIQPIFFMALGLVIICIYLSLILPMYHYMETI
ncbi:competence type IV pilus assembly protein ComGB [Ornithinibacillus xuwenensis]|jgi:competence protein ComGB|uniref:Competence type IV pilus assembly protein ComGB n=1 Tax=Ornithinibacillus xuwenensis TaxID=3144668 RepID=A0ABU9XCL1_9BACI